MKIFFKIFLLFFLSIFTIRDVFAREQIYISGSSTLLPYAKIVSEIFGETHPQYKIPIIESGGSGAGIKNFCYSTGDNAIDIANSSRPINSHELQACSNSNIRDILEIRIGYDGIVFSSDINGPDLHLSSQDIYKAFSKTSVVNGKRIVNKFKFWNQINPKLPAWEITAYIPGEKHGTRDILEQKVMLRGCHDSGAFDDLGKMGLTKKEIETACVSIRKDGSIIDIEGDYSETLARISTNKTSIGVFGLPFYQNNSDRLRVASIDGIVPNVSTISNGEYIISRPLFFYIKNEHFILIPGLKEYIDLFLSEGMIGPDGPLAEYGLIVASESERNFQRSNFEKMRKKNLR